MKNRVRILAAVSKELTARLGKDFRSSTFNFSFAANNMEFLALMEENNFDAILLECNPGANELEPLKISRIKNPLTPVVVIAEKLTVEKELEMMNHGASEIIDSAKISSGNLGRLFSIAIERNLHVEKYIAKKISDHRLEDLGWMVKSIRMLGHEINNPLSRILLSAEKIKEEMKEESDGAFYVSMVNRSTLEIDKLLKDLRKAIQVEINSKSQPLIPIIKNAVKEFLEKEGRELQINENYPEEEIYASIDGEKLTETLRTLLINGKEALKDAAGRLEIVVVKEHNQVLIKITDNGYGIAPGNMENIFAPFYSTKAKSRGLGLTIARQIILLHGGNIFCSSEIGKGSEFIVALKVQD